MKLVNMKCAEEAGENEAGEGEAESSGMIEKPEYPYGLRISLNGESLDKLGISMLPQVGQKMMIQASVQVCSVSQYENQNGNKDRSVDLQITDLGVGSESNRDDARKKLYGE